MGSALRLALYGEPEAECAAAAWLRVSQEFERAEQAMSRFRDSSDLARLNQAAGLGQPRVVDRRVVRALVAARRAQRVTDGRFDGRVLKDLERLADEGTGRDPGTLRSFEPSREWLIADPRRSTVLLDGPIDLGGIGKGLALRWAWRALRGSQSRAFARGSGALLEAGGDLVAGGRAPDGSDWRVGIEDPSDEPGRDRLPRLIAVVSLGRGAAAATSSVAVNRWRTRDGRLVHHLIDPRTGEPGGDGLLAVTVVGDDPAWAEVWSKTLFLAGRMGIATLARARALAAWWVHEDGRLEMTPAARQRTLWTIG
ncbi:MAG TPA: FAD:protein FMN transferase [Candidatus Limnocylindrales bacterium]